MADIVKAVTVREHDWELARRRSKIANAETVEAVAVTVAAMREVHRLLGPGTEAAELVASMLPIGMQRNLGRKLAKAH
jgi:hypothetical protein